MSDDRQLNRREMLKLAGLAAAGAAISPFLSRQSWAADAATQPAKKILFYTRSQTFEHSAIARKDPKVLAPGEKIVTDIAAPAGIEVTCSKDGGLFVPDKLAQFDAFIFFTTGDLTQPHDPNPAWTQLADDNNMPMTAAGKDLFIQQVKDGKGFMAIHSGSDTFHGKPQPYGELMRDIDASGKDDFDPYIQMLGGEFIIHGNQQNATLKCADPNFPGAKSFDNETINEEWYSLKNFAPDLHVILAQETTGMRGNMYQRDAYPETWARMHGKGRVFYTSMGHRDNVWSRQNYRDLLLGAMNWIVGRGDYDVTPNIKTVTPKADPKPFKV